MRLLIPALLLMYACAQPTETAPTTTPTKALQPVVDPGSIDSTFQSWWAYHYSNIKLAADFVAYDAESQRIDKADFLEALTTGEYIAVAMKAAELSYQLYPLDEEAEQGIVSAVEQEALTYLQYLQMEGKPLPAYNFTDLDGNRYTPESTRCKTLVLKTWFVNCTACIKEFPELNELVARHRERDDVLFVSIATDAQDKVERLLRKKTFDYQTVPDQEQYIEKTLDFHTYPTHIIVDENGIVRKIVNKAEQMMAYLEEGEL